jgi:hypothetical protein
MSKWTHFDTIYARMEVATEKQPISIWVFQRDCSFFVRSPALRNLEPLPIRRRRGPQDVLMTRSQVPI